MHDNLGIDVLFLRSLVCRRIDTLSREQYSQHSRHTQHQRTDQLPLETTFAIYHPAPHKKSLKRYQRVDMISMTITDLQIVHKTV